MHLLHWARHTGVPLDRSEAANDRVKLEYLSGTMSRTVSRIDSGDSKDVLETEPRVQASFSEQEPPSLMADSMSTPFSSWEMADSKVKN